MNSELIFESITDGTEFQGCTTNSINQDEKGILWFSTNLGLLKYDGIKVKKIELYRDIRNVSVDNNIASCTWSKDGCIILISRTGNVIDFNPENEMSELIDLPFQNYLRGVDSLRICQDGYMNLWIGAGGTGLFMYNRISKEITHFVADIEETGDTINGNVISNIYYDRIFDKLYIGTYGKGINIYDYKSKKFSYKIKFKKTKIIESHLGISFIFRDTRNNFLVGAPSAFRLLDIHDNVVELFDFHNDDILGNYFRSICEIEAGKYWIGSPLGITYFNHEDKTFEKFRINNKTGKLSNHVENLFKDGSNVVWIGTVSNGIYKCDINNKKFRKIVPVLKPEEKIENNTYTLYLEGSNDIWVGRHDDGAHLLHKNRNNQFELQKIEELEFTTVTGFTRDQEGNLWIGCNKYGLVFRDKKNKINIVDSNILLCGINSPVVYSACQCKDSIDPDILWLSIIYKKLISFDVKKKQVIENKLINEKFNDIPVHRLFVDSSENLWIGTGGKGIFKYDRHHDKINEYEIISNHKSQIINTIAEDEFKNIYIGTQNDGLYKFDNIEEVFRSVYSQYTKISSFIKDNQGFLWLASGTNLFKIDTVTSDSIRYDDLNDFNDGCCLKSEDGLLYFGGKNGITYFKPEEITSNEYIPNIAITDFQIFYESVKPSPENPFLKKSISYAKEITLTFKESVITFEFAALIFNNPKMNQYAYKMEGFDQDWVYCGNRRTATYTNLDPGEYTFRVKGSNNDGLWNEEGTSIRVIITPPWYKTVLFKGLVGLSVIGSIGSFHSKRIQKLNKEKSQQEEFTKKLIESQENERKRVAAELHDSLGQDLLIIKNKLLTNIKKSDDEKYKEQFRELSELTTSTLDDVREISYNLRPYELDRLGLTKTIESMIERANNSTSINFAANIDDIDKVFIPEVEINFYRIIQESLNNVIKHSEASEVNLIIKRSEKEIDINILDNGKGFDVSNYRLNAEKKGFGLKGIEERVRLMNGEFSIESEIGKGTVVEIQLKVKS